jgi:hypothetical protein
LPRPAGIPFKKNNLYIEKMKSKEPVLTRIISVRFSPQEEEKLKEKANNSTLKLTQFIRKAALNRKMDSKTDLLTLAQLRKIGNNINQIARITNAEKTINKTAGSIQKQIEELNDTLNKIIEKL